MIQLRKGPCSTIQQAPLPPHSPLGHHPRPLYFYRSKAEQKRKTAMLFFLQTQKIVEGWGHEEGFTVSVLLKHLQAFCFALIM